MDFLNWCSDHPILSVIALFILCETVLRVVALLKGYGKVEEQERCE